MSKSDFEFEWDPCKDRSSRRKHGISFLEASSVFYDDNAILFDDPDHSEREDRYLLIGSFSQGRLLVISRCYRRNDSIIRLISARKAKKTEENDYYKLNRRRKYA